MSNEERKKKGEYRSVAYDYNDARGALVGLGLKPEEVDHIVEGANDIGTVLIHAMDVFVAKKLFDGGCCHPESLALGVALVAEKFLRVRLVGAGEKFLDPIACLDAIRQFKEVDEDNIDQDDVDTLPPTTIH